MSRQVIYTDLCKMLGLPFSDVDIALACVPAVPELNRRLYDLDQALDALEAFYVRRSEDSLKRYLRRPLPIHRERVRRAEEKRDRIRKWRAEHERPIS